MEEAVAKQGRASVSFDHFLDGFKSRHPEWYGEYEAGRARERFQEALARVPAAEPVKGDEVPKVKVLPAVAAVVSEIAGVGEIDWSENAEEAVDEEAEAEEQTAVLSDGEF